VFVVKNYAFIFSLETRHQNDDTRITDYVMNVYVAETKSNNPRGSDG